MEKMRVNGKLIRDIDEDYLLDIIETIEKEIRERNV